MRLGFAACVVAAPMFFSQAAAAAEKVCELTIEGNDAMQYDKKELAVGADCTSVKLTLKHTGKMPKTGMGHNWVLVKEADAAAVATAAMSAGVAKDYVPDDKRILANTSLVGGGESTSVTFKTDILKKGEKYKYICTFPAHSNIMNGVLKF